MTVAREDESAARGRVTPENLRVVRVGHGGNCSSVGSVIDTLFVGAAVGGAVLAAICAAMGSEEVTVVGEPAREAPDARGGTDDAPRAHEPEDGA